MKSVKNFNKEKSIKKLPKDGLHKIYGGTSSDTTTTRIVKVGNSIVDDLNGLIR